MIEFELGFLQAWLTQQNSKDIPPAADADQDTNSEFYVVSQGAQQERHSAERLADVIQVALGPQSRGRKWRACLRNPSAAVAIHIKAIDLRES